MGGTSQIDDYCRDQSNGYAGNIKLSGQGSKIAKTPTAAENLSTWEMDDYYGGGSKNSAVVTAYGGDESGSEKNLTTPSSPVPKDMIGVR
jgi:hypothetical protein